MDLAVRKMSLEVGTIAKGKHSGRLRKNQDPFEFQVIHGSILKKVLVDTAANAKTQFKSTRRPVK